MRVVIKTGSATSIPNNGKGIIIGHVVNSIGAWGAGFVLAVNKLSHAARRAYQELAVDHTSNIPLGITQFVEVKPNVFISNMVAQRGIKARNSNECLVSYDELEKCLHTTLKRASQLGFDVNFPAGMGSGLAGGDKTQIVTLIEKVAAEYPNTQTVTLWEFDDTSADSYIKSQPKVASQEDSKIDESLRMLLSDMDVVLDVIVVGVDHSAFEQLCNVPELRVRRTIESINAVAGGIRSQHVVPLSESTLVRSIELDKEAATQSKTGPQPSDQFVPDYLPYILSQW